MASAEPKFHEFDLTLTDRELEDFLSFMEHQTTGGYADSIPQLPDAAADFPGLQLQPHSGSPSNSEGSECMGVDAPAPFPGSTTSLCTATAAAAAAAAAAGGSSAAAGAVGTPILPKQLPCMMDTSAACDPLAAACDVKMEPQSDLELAPRSGSSSGAGVAVPVPQAAGKTNPAAALPPAAGSSTGSMASPHATGTVSLAAAVSLPSGVCLPTAPLGTWPPGAAGPQLLFMPAHQAAIAAAQQQQQQQMMRQTSMNNNSSGCGGSRDAAAARQSNGGSKGGLHRSGGGCGDGGSGGGGGSGKLQISHSTVEKQRRDRLNSLIDELSDIVPPADPKYGSDAASVRRPKHVVLADTINLLKAMQTKLQLEEAEICTLKQQAVAVATMAAQQGTTQAAAAGAAAAAAMMAAGQGGCGLVQQGSLDSSGNGSLPSLPSLPLPPESAVASTGVLVEQGINCLYVKVNCRDRKGLLADVVSALKAFPIVISTAAITTTRDGKVHDVFEVRSEDDSVTAEDIQCAVHLALFTAERARSKRLRQAGGGEDLAAC